jgi:CspA family cold shock protein
MAARQGRIVRLVPQKSFGFVRAGEVEFFFHRNAVEGTSFDELREGQTVSFIEGNGDRGPRAERVRVATEQAALS